jgi:hypothetical protein
MSKIKKIQLHHFRIDRNLKVVQVIRKKIRCGSSGKSLLCKSETLSSKPISDYKNKKE